MAHTGADARPEMIEAETLPQTLGLQKEEEDTGSTASVTRQGHASSTKLATRHSHLDRAALHPRSRKPLPFGRGMKRFLSASIMPEIKAALAKMSIVAPEDPQLWLAKYFLAISSAGTAYEIRRQNAVVRTFLAAGSSSMETRSTVEPSLGVRVNLSQSEKMALSEATAPGPRSLSRITHPTLQPLTVWQKRVVRIVGKVVDSSSQTGAEGLGIDIGCQATKKQNTVECQTLMTGTEALETLGAEMEAYKLKCEHMQSEELAIAQVFKRVVLSSGIEKRLSKAFKVLDLQGRGFLTRTSLLMGLTRHPDAFRSVPVLRSLFRPSNWSLAFDEIVRERECFPRPSDTLKLCNKQWQPSRDPRRIREADFLKYLASSWELLESFSGIFCLKLLGEE